MAIVINRVLRNVIAGVAVGADDLDRFLASEERTAIVARVTGEARERAEAVIAEARAVAAAILAQAEVDADAVRARAQAEGFARGHDAGHDAGHATALADLAPLAALLRAAADGADQVRGLLLAGVEEQAVALALEAARRVVGEAAEMHAGLAGDVVRNGMRTAGGRVVRVRVHPDDAAGVTVTLQNEGKDMPVIGDESIEIGGCILQVEGGTVDLRLSTQLESIAQAFVPHAA